MTKTYYIAHPLVKRYEVRDLELRFEVNTGIQLFNPFYDGAEKAIIKRLDNGEVTLENYHESLDHTLMVNNDLLEIQKADGLIAYVDTDVKMAGTFFEMWEALKLSKPVYVVTSNWMHHIWGRYITEQS